MKKLIEKQDNHSISKIGYHLVWCTKCRKPILINEVELTVRNIIGQACTEYGWRCIELEIMPEYVHLFIQTCPSDTPNNVVKTLKSLTAVAVFSTFPKLKAQKFWGSGLWSRGAYYATVGDISQETIIKYIQNQKKGETHSSSTTRVEVSCANNL